MKKEAVVIDSVGGRGKSALLREVVQRAIDQFRKNDKYPIPVICSGDILEGKTIIELIKSGLGEYVISDDFFLRQLELGDFFPVIDGITESCIKPEMITGYVKSKAGASSPLIVSKRPDDIVTNALRQAASRVEIEPVRLDEDSYKKFESFYLAADKIIGIQSKPLTEMLKRICRTADGTYLPVLVRICLIAGDDSSNDIRDIYEGAFKKLVKGDDFHKEKLLKDATELCLNTYWKNGMRVIPYAVIPLEKKEVVDTLYESQILIAISSNKINGSPQELVFLHDSLQSFLTALGLFKQEDWQLLSTAAGAPKFNKRGSDIFGETGSELFQMCLTIFGPKELLRDQLRQDLLHWADAYDDFILKLSVKEAIPSSIQINLASIDPDKGAGSLLKLVIDSCVHSSIEEEVMSLAYVYMRLAPVVYPCFESKTQKEEGTQSVNNMLK